jgi:hypothetical protein
MSVVCLKVLLELFQKLVGAAAIGGRASQGAKLPYPSKAPQRGEFSPKAKRGEPHKWGVPLSTQALSKPFTRFFL